MGITGLLPFLEKGKVSRPANIREFSGCTVAADAYCWLHKGAFSCADKLARGEETDMFVQYCLKFVNMLLSHNIKPILVFDGRHLPAKAATEKKRRDKREENRKQAASLLRQGHSTEALSFLRRCIDVTHKMALTVMKECRKRNVDCIVAPYEADAQLAFFSLEHIADLIITEDSDLLLFGCRKVMFKLDLAGNGVLVDQSRLYQAMGVRPETYSFDKFRYMCILSGCDYLESLPGIGLGKACKFISRTQDPDIHKALTRLPSQLNIRSLSVPVEYRDEFMKADAMFRHQLVFDPQTRKTRPLTPFQGVHPASPLAAGPLPGCEPEFDDHTCYQLALGNLDPFKLEKVDDYDPDLKQITPQNVKTNGWNQLAIAPHPSIWDAHYKDAVAKKKIRATPSFLVTDSRPVCKGKSKTVDTSLFVDKSTKKRSQVEETDFKSSKKTCLDSEKSNLAAMYFQPPVSNSSSASPIKLSSHVPTDSPPTSPILCDKRMARNPFARSTSCSSSSNTAKVAEPLPENSLNSSFLLSSPSPKSGKFGALSKFARAIHRTSTEGKPIVQSRYFSASQPSSNSEKNEFGEEKEKISNEFSEEKEKLSDAIQDQSNSTSDGNQDLFKEQLSHMGYVQNTCDSTKSPMLHRKPLFAISPNTSGNKDFHLDSHNHSEDIDQVSSDVSSLKGMLQERFSKPSKGVTATSPSKNPFRKKASFNEEIKESENIEIKSHQSSRPGVIPFVSPDEAIDDPGFGLTPDPSSSSSPMVCSQPDEGFESPSKAEFTQSSPTTSLHNSLESMKHKKKVCRISGLRKSAPSPGQSKLSAFGFLSKAKIQKA